MQYGRIEGLYGFIVKAYELPHKNRLRRDVFEAIECFDPVLSYSLLKLCTFLTSDNNRFGMHLSDRIYYDNNRYFGFYY